MKKSLSPGVYVGLITARSSEEPARDITYTIAIRLQKKEIIFEGVSPQKETRITSIDPELFAVPFPLGTRVTIFIFEEGDTMVAMIGDSELPHVEEC